MALTRPRYSQIYDTDYKQSVELASTGDVGNLIVGNAQPNSIDGVSVAVGNRILVKDQTSPWQNGIYSVRSVGTGANGWWERSLDANQAGFITAGMTTAVTLGSANGNKQFKLTTPDPITIGVTSLTFVNPFAASASGANTQVQFNDNNSVNATAGFTFNKFTNAVSVGGNISSSGYIITTGASGNISGVNYYFGNGLINGTTSINTYGSSNVTISAGGTSNVLVVSSSNIYIAGSIIPSANISYDLGSPTRKFRSAYFSGNTVYIGSESISVDPSGTWAFTSGGTTVSLGSSVALNPPSLNTTGNILSTGAIHNSLTVNGNENVTGTLNVTGQTTLGNLTVNNNLTVYGNITTIGNVNQINITGNSGQFFGNVAGFGALYAGIGTGYVYEPQTILQISSNFNGYAQLNMQNINSGAQSSADFIVTANNGNVNDTYVDLGMASSTYNYPGFGLLKPNDGYLLVYGNTVTRGGNLVLGAGGGGLDNDIIFAVGGFDTANEFGRIDGTGNIFVIKSAVPSTTTTTGAVTIAGGLGVVGNINAGFFIGNGAQLTGLPAGYSNVQVATYLPGYSGTIGASLINSTGNVLATGAILNSLTVNGTTTAQAINASLAINTVGNILSTGAIHNSLTVNGGITSTGYFNTSANISGAIINTSTVNSASVTINSNTSIRSFTLGGGELSIVGQTGATPTSFINIHDYAGNYGNAATLYIRGLITNGSASALINVFNVQAVTSQFAGNIIPTVDNLYNLGSGSFRWNTVFAKATSAQYADLAEIYASDKKYVPGTVLVFGGNREVTVSLASHDPSIAGVVSTNPAYLMNDSADGVAVALQGRVPCRVLGPVVKGDRVVSSDIRGVAERLDMTKYQPGCIIGKALDAVPDGEIATIEVVVGRN